ncbi:MAG TPA: dihydroorotate dehydrogenase-like protein [Nitrospira sp.]|nr:dihydroorotate dehydrogenase-like protein [Nitrospira sp.]
MDLSTTYLGMSLPHPLMPGASPLVDDMDMVKRLEDAGAAAIVMHSLFEEQISGERAHTLRQIEAHTDSFSEAPSFFPCCSALSVGPEPYLEQIRQIKAAVCVPVIGSLNGTTASGWLDYARMIQQAGADAIELNFYVVATDPSEHGEAVEQRALDIYRKVKAFVTIPVAVKLSPFFCSFAHVASQLDGLGADGLVLFNRFYQPDIDIETLEVIPRLQLSDSSELLLRLRWLAILSGHVRATLGVSGGVHTAVDAIKAVMAGAHGVQLVSALLQHGPERLKTIREEMVRWMEEHEYQSLRQMQGSMNLTRCPDPAAFERANYVRVLHSWRP